MANYSVIQVTHNESAVDIKAQLQAPATNKTLQITRLQAYLNALAGGARLGTLTVNAGAVRAAGTLTFAGVVATDTFVINGVTFTCVASGATGNQFNVGGSDTISAANAAAAVNASVTALVAGAVVASSVGAVLTLTAVDPGQNGNAMTLVGGAHLTASGARLTGGSNGTQAVHKFGGSSL